MFFFVVNSEKYRDNECASLSVYQIHNKRFGIYWIENTLSRLFTILKSCNVSSMTFSICNVVKWGRYIILLPTIYETKMILDEILLKNQMSSFRYCNMLVWMSDKHSITLLILYLVVGDNSSLTMETSTIRPCNNCIVFVQYSSMIFQK